MRKIDKINKEKMHTEIILDWFARRGYYNHDLDCIGLYKYMYWNCHLSWHKVQRIIFKNIPKKVLDDLSYQ